jgi:hypothetical protein
MRCFGQQTNLERHMKKHNHGVMKDSQQQHASGDSFLVKSKKNHKKFKYFWKMKKLGRNSIRAKLSSMSTAQISSDEISG